MLYIFLKKLFFFLLLTGEEKGGGGRQLRYIVPSIFFAYIWRDIDSLLFIVALIIACFFFLRDFSFSFFIHSYARPLFQLRLLIYRHGVARAYSYSRGILCYYIFFRYAWCVFIYYYHYIILYHCNLNLLSSMRESFFCVSTLTLYTLPMSIINNICIF